MTSDRDTRDKPSQPALAELFKQYLHRQALASTDGLAIADAAGEVSPYDAAPVQPVDPRLAWNDALMVLQYVQISKKTPSMPLPADWPGLVAHHEPAISLAFAVGNFPQLVRNLQPLWHIEKLSSLRPAKARSSPMPSLVEWATETAHKQHYPETLLAIGALRLAKQFAGAMELLNRTRTAVPAEWQPAWANEEAALAWHEGNGEAAASMWEAQPSNVPVLFNRGMAALFLGRPAEARPPLTQAVAELSEDSAWHHLGRLYLALAERRA